MELERSLPCSQKPDTQLLLTGYIKPKSSHPILLMLFFHLLLGLPKHYFFRFPTKVKRILPRMPATRSAHLFPLDLMAAAVLNCDQVDKVWSSLIANYLLSLAIKKLLGFKELEYSLPCSQQPNSVNCGPVWDACSRC